NRMHAPCHDLEELRLEGQLYKLAVSDHAQCGLRPQAFEPEAPASGLGNLARGDRGEQADPGRRARLERALAGGAPIARKAAGCRAAGLRRTHEPCGSGGGHGVQGCDRGLAYPQRAQGSQGQVMTGMDKDPFERLSQIATPEPDPAKIDAVAAMSARAFSAELARASASEKGR